MWRNTCHRPCRKNAKGDVQKRAAWHTVSRAEYFRLHNGKITACTVGRAAMTRMVYDIVFMQMQRSLNWHSGKHVFL
jgi:hypothetical protein